MTPSIKQRMEEAMSQCGGYDEATWSTEAKYYRKGGKKMAELILEMMRSDEAKAAHHCSKTVRDLFGQTPEVMAQFIESNLKKDGVL